MPTHRGATLPTMAIIALLVPGCMVGWDNNTDIGPPTDDDDNGSDDDDNGDDDDASPGNNSCDTAIDLGLVPDDGSHVTADECLGGGDWIWYRFLAGDMVGQDVADGGDAWGVNVLFAHNQDDVFRIRVFQGDCQTEQCPEMGVYDTYTMAMDQDPCGVGYNDCADDSSDFFVKVFNDSAKASCRDFILQITNG